MTDRPIAAGLPRRKLVAEWLRQKLLEGKRTQLPQNDQPLNQPET